MKTVNLCIPYHWGSVGHKVFQYLFETIMGCLVPFTLINICYSAVLCRLKKARFQSRGQGSRLILMIMCAFAVFWLPYHIVNIIEVILYLSHLDKRDQTGLHDANYSFRRVKCMGRGVT